MRRWELLTALGAAWWFEKVMTLEWSYPYCSVRDDGPAGAVFGFPLPYEQASIVDSATHFFIPWLYVVNLIAIAGAVFLVLHLLGPRFGTSKPRALKLRVGAIGAALLLTAILLEVSALSMGVWRPTSSFSESPRFSELRPVAVAFRRQRDCTASPFWFANKPRSAP